VSVPNREIAARLAGLRRFGVDLERRLRGDARTAPDSEVYWRTQIADWRAEIEGTLPHHPFQLRVLQQPIPPAPDGDEDWASAAFREIAEIRSRVDATIERLNVE
jgi:hypothetical protein